MDCHGQRLISGNASRVGTVVTMWLARLGRISCLRLSYKEDTESENAKKKKVEQEKKSSFTSISLGWYLWNYFQFGENKLRKGDKKRRWGKKYLIKSHTGTEGRGRGTRLPERQIEWLRSMRVPHVRHVFSWVNQTLHLLGGNWRASWERWPLLCSASGPPSAVWACSNWHSISPNSWGCTYVDYRLAMSLSLNHHRDFLISLEYNVNEVINDSLFSAARIESQFKTFREHEFLFQFHELSCLINNKLLIRPVIDKAEPLDIYIPTRDTSA